MGIKSNNSQRPLARRLVPFACALLAMIGLIMVLTWGALQIQITLAGFLNGESTWSKAQKQAVIDLDAFALTGATKHLDDFQRNARVLQSDRWGRDAIASGRFKHSTVADAFLRSDVIPAAVPGMIFIFQYFADAPHLSAALAAWRSTDGAIKELGVIALQLKEARMTGELSADYARKQRLRIQELNRFIEPRTAIFSLEIARGAIWVGTIVFGSILAIGVVATLIWISMTRRILLSLRGTEEVNQRTLEYLARHDPLTGMINRSEFERQCCDAIVDAQEDRLALAVLFVDLDAFKIINDSYSHAVGDHILATFAARIAAQLSHHDVAGHVGGDEFLVLVRHLDIREDVQELADRLLIALAEPVVVNGNHIMLTASIGISGYPLDGGDVPTLIANADAAMHVAKCEERNAFRFYTPVMQVDARQRLQLVNEMRQAMDRKEFRLVYQPSVEMKTGRIVAAEALVRWRHPERGEILPGEFIPVAEAMGMIRGIDEFVLQAVCDQICTWDLRGVPPIRVAVNISAWSFAHPGFIEIITRTLRSKSISPKRVLLEITESAMLRLGDGTVNTLKTLHSMGIDVAIDDFGTGYSSMAYLKLPAVAYLKIDRSFVSGLPASSNDAAIAGAMLAMSRSLGLVTIGEGVETEAQHEFLLEAGCVEGQGWLYSYPLEPDVIEDLMRPRYKATGAKLRLVPPSRSY